MSDSEPKFVISNNAISSVAASLASICKRCSEEEKAYDELLKTCVLKPHGHSRSSLDAGLVFTITTIASSQRYGGNRTPIVCSSFSTAREYVENNIGDLFYSLVVIEVIALDHLYNGDIKDSYWYQWVDGSYKAIETPDVYKDRTVQPIG